MRFAQATPYVVAVAVILITVGLKHLLDPIVEQERSPLLFLVAAVMVSAWFGNWRAGLVTLLLAGGLTFFLGPADEPTWRTEGAIRATLFMVEGGLILGFVAVLHRARERAEHSRRETAATIAQREEADRSLRSSRARFRRLVEANIIGVFFCEEDDRVFDANQSFLSLLGYDEADVRQGRLNVAEITPREFIDVTMAAAVELAQEGRCQPYEKELIRKDGTRLPVLIGTALLSESEGQTVSFAIDLSEQKATESELQQAKDEAEHANRLKSDFLANISHELRTPMNAILGMTQLALDEELSPTVREYLETAYESGRSLLSLVNEILDFSKMEAGRFELEMAPFRLRELLDESFRSLALQAAEKNLELSADVAWDVPDELIGDAHRLRQVVINLVGNGIKFTNEGQVALDVTVASRTSDEIVLHFTVIDTGIGISEDDQERIFAPFTQVDTSTTRRYGGTGLGLAISSELIRMHGGRLELQSTLGQGSRFDFDARFGLPEPGPGDALPALSAEELQGLPVLVVGEDSPDRQQLEALLQQWQLETTWETSGNTALKILRDVAAANRSSQATWPEATPADSAETPGTQQQSSQRPGAGETEFGLVLIGPTILKVDAVELAAQIRRDPRLSGMAVVMLAALPDHDRQRCNAWQIPCLPQPWDEASLLDAISFSLSVPPLPLQHGRLSADTRSCPPLHVLLAEDTPANCHVVRSILQKRGHRVTVASDGQQAVEAVQQQSFDAILMDVQMPEMDGLKATTIIRADEEQNDRPPVPIIAMTAHAMKGDRYRCLAAGMNAYLAKPIDAHKLIELLESVACRRPTASMDEAGPAAIEPLPIDAPAGEPSAASKVGSSGQLYENSQQWPAKHGMPPAGTPGAALRAGIRQQPENGSEPSPKKCGNQERAAPPVVAEMAIPGTAEPEPPTKEDTVNSKATPPSLDEAPLEVPERVHCDLDRALARLGNNRGLLADMFGFYREDAPQLIETIRQGVDKQDRDATSIAAHSLKGLSSSFDASDNVKAAARIEQLAVAGRFEVIAGMLDDLSTLTEKLIEQIAAELDKE